MKRLPVVLTIAALLLTAAAPVRSRLDWERDFRTELAKYQGSQACRPSPYNLRKLRKLRTEAARRGYSVRMNQIAREEGWKQAHTNVLCAKERLGR